MPTAEQKQIALFDNEGQLQLQFFINVSNGVTIQTDETKDAPYQQFWTASKEDWENIKEFIDNQFKELDNENKSA